MHTGKQAIDRGSPPTLNLLMCGKMSQDHGIIFSSGEIWKETRRFTLRALRDMGFGKKTSESLVLEESRAVIVAIQNLANNNNGVIGRVDDEYSGIEMHTFNDGHKQWGRKF